MTDDEPEEPTPPLYENGGWLVREHRDESVIIQTPEGYRFRGVPIVSEDVVTFRDEESRNQNRIIGMITQDADVPDGLITMLRAYGGSEAESVYDETRWGD
jgi:hypothetical protein